MRLLIQRVNHASVKVDGEVIGNIGKGFLVLVGIGQNDTREVADKYMKKMLGLRIFEDENGKTNLSLADVNGELLMVSQFTLYANYKNGKDAVTHYKVLERFGNATYIECRLETGRTHQIRVHMTSLGHPLLGDEIYGSGKNPYHLQGQTLHAMVLGFVHPRTGEYMEFSAPLPEYFLDLLEKLRK